MNISITRKTLGLLLAGSLLACSAFVVPPAVLAADTMKEQPASKVNINTADAQTMADLLLGIGLSKAKAIVKFRDERGKFTHIEQLKEVSGIGQAIINLNKTRITLE